MRGRRITDQTELANLTVKCCANKGVNGAIISLDQEKAY